MQAMDVAKTLTAIAEAAVSKGPKNKYTEMIRAKKRTRLRTVEGIWPSKTWCKPCRVAPLSFAMDAIGTSRKAIRRMVVRSGVITGDNCQVTSAATPANAQANGTDIENAHLNKPRILLWAFSES